MRSTLILSLFLTLAAPLCHGDAADGGDFHPRVYPNPINASSADPSNQVMHVDQVDAGSVMSIFNMVGEKIYNKVLPGDVWGDTWDLVNSNGVHVVTGVYIVAIQNPSGKTSVQRIAILQ